MTSLPWSFASQLQPPSLQRSWCFETKHTYLPSWMDWRMTRRICLHIFLTNTVQWGTPLPMARGRRNLRRKCEDWIIEPTLRPGPPGTHNGSIPVNLQRRVHLHIRIILHNPRNTPFVQTQILHLVYLYTQSRPHSFIFFLFLRLYRCLSFLTTT